MPPFLVVLMRRAAAFGAAALFVLSAALAGPAAAADGDALRFDILEYVVEGDTLLGPAAIEAAVYPFLGERRTAADAEGARRALEKAYQDAGWLSVSVTLPPQSVERGEIRLVVSAVPVGRLRVTGAEYQLPSQVREAVPAVAPGQVPNFHELQSQLGQFAQARPDTQVTPLLSPGTRPGTLDVELRQKDTLPLHGSVEINDKQSPGTSRGRLETAVSWDNLFQRRHSIGLNWIVSPREPSQTSILSLAYQFPLGGPGDRLSAVFTTSDSDTPTAFGGLTVSRGETLRLRWRDQLGARTGLQHAFSWGLTARFLQDRNLGVGGVDIEPPPLRYTTLSAGYELSLQHGDNAQGPSSRLSAEASFGPPGLNARQVDCFGEIKSQFACKRANALDRFQVLTLNLVHRHPIGAWQLDAELQAQFTDTPLVSAEQAVYGGSSSVRGTLEGEEAGDIGAALRLQLLTPTWQPLAGVVLRGFGFTDLAALRRLYALPSEVVAPRLGSAGLGVQLETRFGLSGTLSWSRRLFDARLAEVADERDRVNLALRQSF